jgi:hypothetical protein
VIFLNIQRLVRTVLVFAFLWFATAFFARAEPNFPVVPDASWEYEISGSAADPVHTSTMVVRAVGTEKSNDKELVRLETRIADKLTKTEVVAADDHGLFCYRRISSEGKITSLNPPQIIIPDPLSVGAKWEMDDSVGGNQMHLQFEVVAAEDVVVPAGTFHAFHAQSEQPWPLSMTIERWFVAGVGMVKDITSTRGPNGRLLTRVTTALTKFSPGRVASAGPGPSVVVPSSSPPAAPSFKVEIAKEREGTPVAEIKSDALHVFVRWSGENLPVHSIVRIAWVAEDVGDVAPPNFVVDETKTEVTEPTFGARFTLSRPKDGWAAGKYRVDLYLSDELSATARITIRD